MYIVEGTKIDSEGNPIKVREKFESLLEADMFAKQTLDGYTIQDNVNEKIMIIESNKKEKELDINEPKYRLEFYKVDKNSSSTKIGEKLYHSRETASIRYYERPPDTWCKMIEIATGKILENDQREVMEALFEKSRNEEEE